LISTSQEQDVDNDIERQSPDEPEETSTGKKILALTIPALGALMIDPLMTLADTAFVGRFSTTADALAGMGSSAALLTFSFFTFNFFCTATTPLVGTRRSSGDEAGALQIGGQALSLSLAVGCIVTATLLLLAQPLLQIMGTDITGAEASRYAMDFLTIRAFAAPAVLCISASTGVLRGYLDTTTPIYVLVFANILNLLLDVVLIAGLDMGPMGAAIATTTAEWLSAILFLGVLAGKLPAGDGQLGSNPPKGKSTLSVVPSVSIPEWNEIKPLVVASSSVLLRTAVLQITLSSAAAMAARSEGGTASVAAHQIAIQLWMLCSFVADALAAASQGLVADGIGRDDHEAVRDVSLTVFAYSLILGFALSFALWTGDSTTFLLDFFTSDEATQAILSKILAIIILAQPLNSIVFAADGVLQGVSEFAYQAKAMALSGAIAWISFIILQEVYGTTDTLLHVWIALIVLQFMRGITSFVKIVEKDGPIDLLK
jgi:putative MATE family efflux protein